MVINSAKEGRYVLGLLLHRREVMKYLDRLVPAFVIFIKDWLLGSDRTLDGCVCCSRSYNQCFSLEIDPKQY